MATTAEDVAGTARRTRDQKFADSPLEEAGFELLVPQSRQLGGVNAGRRGGAYLPCLLSKRTSHKSGARTVLSLQGSHTLSGKAGQLQT